MEISREIKIIAFLLVFIIIWMSLSFKNVFCTGRAGFELCYKKSCPMCQTCPTPPVVISGQRAATVSPMSM